MRRWLEFCKYKRVVYMTHDELFNIFDADKRVARMVNVCDGKASFTSIEVGTINTFLNNRLSASVRLRVVRDSHSDFHVSLNRTDCM